MKIKPTRSQLWASAALLSFAAVVHAATWTGAGPDLNWSTIPNWDSGVPTAADDVFFGKTTGYTNGVGLVNNIWDSDFTIGTLSYSALLNNYHTTLIPEGRTLTVTGTRTVALGTGYTTTDTLFVGSGAADGTSAKVYATILGGGSLVVSNAAGNIDVTQTTTGTSSSTRATLDMSALDTFIANINQIRVGFGSGDNNSGGNRPSGTLILAKTNVITCNSTTWGLALGQTSSNQGQPSTNLLGVANWINSTYGIGVGRRKCSATLSFAPGLEDSFVVFRDATGVGPMSFWTIGDNYDSGNTGVGLTGIADFTGGMVDAQVANTIYVGRSYNSSGGTSVSTATGRLSFDDGAIMVNNLEVGYQQSSSSGSAVGEFNLGGTGVLVVTNNLRVARFAGGAGTATGTVNMSGGTVYVGGRVYDGGGSSTVNITGGLLDLQPPTDPDAGDIAVDTLTLSNATITNAAAISANVLTLGAGAKIVGDTVIDVAVGASIDASGAGVLTLGPTQTLQGQGTITGEISAGDGATIVPATQGIAGTLGFINGLTLAGGAVLPYDLSDQPTFGNDQLTVGGGLTLSGTNKIEVNAMNSALGLGTYTLMTYGTTLSGGATNLELSGPILQSRSTIEIDTSTSGQVNLLVSGSAPQSLTWVGDGLNNIWNINGDANWNNGIGADKFFAFDSVTFDDTGSVSPAVNLQGTLNTPSITMNNLSKSYTFSGTGAVSTASLSFSGGGSLKLANEGENLISKISGSGTLIKAGDNTLTLAGDNSLFSGGIQVEGGTLRAGSTSALGDSIGATVVTTGGTLDVNGQNLGAELVHVSGTGVAGRGAIDNTGLEQQNALQNVTLDADTAFGASTQRWDIIAGGSGLVGNGFALTKVGSREIWIKSALDTDLGNVDIVEGRLGFQNAGTALGRPAATLTIRTNASLGFWNNPAAGNKNIVMDDGSLISAGGGDCVFGGTVSLNGTNTFSPSGVTNYCDALVSGAGFLVKEGSGVLQLSAANTFSSDIIVNTGSLLVTNPAGLGPAKTIVLTGSSTTGTAAPNPGSTLRLEGDVTLPAAYPVSMLSTATGNLRTLLAVIAGTNTLASPVTLSGDGLCQVAVNSATAQLTMDGDITGAPGFSGVLFVRGGSGLGIINGKINLGAGNFSKTDGNTWIINSTANTWGLTTIAVGTVKIGATDALCPTAPLQMGQPSGGNSTLDLAGMNQEVGGLQNAGTSTQVIGNSSTTGNSTLTVNAGTNTFTYDKLIADSVSGGTMKVNLNIASGTQNLTTANTYSGSTLIGGTLGLVGSGSILNSSSIILSGGTLDASARTDGTLTLANGQTLAGNGTVLGAVIAPIGSTVAPGTSIGTLNFGSSLALQGGTVMEVQKQGTTLTSDLVNSATSINYGGSLTVSATGDTLAEGDSFKLFSALAYAGSGFEPMNLPPLPSGLGWSNRLALDGTIRVISVPTVPTTPTNITFAVSGGNLTISWPADYVGWSLQAQTNSLAVGIGANWVTVPGTETSNSATFPINPAAPTVFYRLFYQVP